MLKRSTSSRIQRSRGVRVKHVLQIAVLLGICFWLLYQVKYSHDKRRELSGKDAKVSSMEEVSSDALKLGRKGLNPRLEEVREKNEKGVHEEEEEDDKHDEGEEEREEDTSKTEVDPSEETKKHVEEEEQEGGEKEHEVEEEEEAKGDELEDQDRLVGEVDREEDFLDEEKEREEEASEDKDEEKEIEEEPSEDKATAEGAEDEDEVEKHGLAVEENQNFNGDEERDEIDSSTHEAREENYKGDDASSAVTHDNNQLIGSGMEKLDTNYASKSMTATNTSNQFNDEDKDGSKSGRKEHEMAEKGLILKETGAEKKDNEDGADAAKVLEDSPPQNSSVSTENNVINVTSSEMNTEDSSTPPNGTDTVVLHSPQVQNSTVDEVNNSKTTSDGEEADPVFATTNAGLVESSNSTGTDLKPDHKLSSDEKGDGGGNIKLVSTLNNTQNQESEESKNESGEIKTG